MKITFIHPGMGKKAGHKYIGTWKMEPLTYAVLKALLPPQVETEFFDDRIELIDYETATDIVMMSVETYTARRA
ncbi:MAG: radical SAM protein, partial [Clostridiales bacterium]|nr:radical SAM protein [Clostridiales bacterium]